MPEKKRVVLLGATGSVGESTLSVLRKHADRFSLLGIAANNSQDELDNIAREFEVPHQRLFKDSGIDGLMELSTLPEADIIIVATTGTVAVRPTIAALEAGKKVGLANKETLVLAGQFVIPVARKSKGTLLPVDSEHNAIWQCLEGLADRSHLRRIHLTASGGPFLNHTRKELEEVTTEEALKHPNWDMGVKITVDSSTMANKGLEMIEARWLFDLEPDQVRVVIHPQSIIHSMAEFRDGSIIAQMAPPSMTFPIQHVLAYPDRLESCQDPLDFERILRLDLRPPDEDKFPCLRLARTAMEMGGLAPAVFNTANEIAVEAFVQNQIPFLAIADLIEHTMSTATFTEPGSLDELLDLEPEISKLVRSGLAKFSKGTLSAKS